jgi:hypothetical protein
MDCMVGAGGLTTIAIFGIHETVEGIRSARTRWHSLIF